jgi:DNA-binding NarL/FixJ family response regulator
MDKISILIVEDNPGDIVLIREYLAEKPAFRHHIMEAATLAAAMELLGGTDFDVVLLDLSLPDSSGLDTVRTIVTRFPDIAVVVLTGLQNDDIAFQAVRYGAQDYLEKQLLSPALLYKSIMYAIERKQAMQQKEELLNNLTAALEKIHSLEGILPICVSCKKILTDDQQWVRVEMYDPKNSGIGAGQMLCPECQSALDSEFHS